MLLTAQQVAEKLQLSTNTVRQMCADGRIAATNVAKKGTRARWRIDEKDLRAFRATQRNGHVDVADVVPAGWIPSKEAAARAGIHPATIAYRIHAGLLRGVKVKGAFYVPPAEVEPSVRADDFPAAAPEADAQPRGITTLLRDVVERLGRIENNQAATQHAIAALQKAWT